MTVISAVISKYCTVHVSDSLLTIRQADGTLMPMETDKRKWKRTKIVRVPAWRGALAYWGLAYADPNDSRSWSTLRWLEAKAREAGNFASPEAFANGLGSELNRAIGNLPRARSSDRGIGIHFTAYENVEGFWIPELYQINNFTDSSYLTLSPDGMHVTRETYHAAEAVAACREHRRPECRHQVRKHLQDGRILVFNQGDPRLFNVAAKGLYDMLEVLSLTNRLADLSDPARMCSFARMPVDQVSRIQKTLCLEGKRAVGGKTHVLAVTPGGVYFSPSGD